jgi:hypothetical protein
MFMKIAPGFMIANLRLIEEAGRVARRGQDVDDPIGRGQPIAKLGHRTHLDGFVAARVPAESDQAKAEGDQQLGQPLGNGADIRPADGLAFEQERGGARPRRVPSVCRRLVANRTGQAAGPRPT